MTVMQWKKKNVDQYLEAKEYIDTMLIPLMPFQIAEDSQLSSNAFQNEVLTVFSLEIEKELAGRIMLAPNYNYLLTADRTDEITRLNKWTCEIMKQPFKHIFLFSFDAGWKKYEKSLDGNLLWIPGIPSGDINSKETQSSVRQQVAQVCELIRSYW